MGESQEDTNFIPSPLKVLSGTHGVVVDIRFLTIQWIPSLPEYSVVPQPEEGLILEDRGCNTEVLQSREPVYGFISDHLVLRDRVC